MSVITTARTWAEMIKFGHSVFALPFALIATFLAGRHLPAGHPTIGQFLLIVAAMVSARSVAMTFNRIADLRYDAANPRTANRALVTGQISKQQAWGFFTLMVIAFLLSCAGFYWLDRNPWPLYFAVPILFYLCGYSFSKRWTRWSHFWLGSAIALSPLAAWVAVHPTSVGLPAVLLVLIVTGWIGGFDIIYACQDIDFDRQANLHSLPARLGPKAALNIARLAHGTAIIGLIALGITANLGWLYYAGVSLATVLLIAENRLVKPNDFSRINLAFFTINGIVSIVLAIAAISDILLKMPPMLSLLPAYR